MDNMQKVNSPATFVDLSTGYSVNNRNVVITSNLNAVLHRGEMTCLLGANGAGKSTLIKTLCGFLKPLQGKAYLSGEDVSKISVKEMAKMVSVVLTDKVEIANVTVGELTELGRSPYTGFMGRLSDADNHIVSLAMQQAGIYHKKHQTINSLSDGERQKAFIAKALAQDTPLIILDEPTAFLDLPARVEVMHLLRSLCSNFGKTILITTHDLDLALQMADRLWLLHKNGPMISGTPEDLILSKSIQQIFSNHGIEFDNKTGLFRIAHACNKQIQLKGHGFGYVLLRRALSRKGIQPVNETSNMGLKIEVAGIDEPNFKLFSDNKVIFESSQTEELMKLVINMVEMEKEDVYAYSKN